MAKVTGLEERRKLIKDAKATEVRVRSKFYVVVFLLSAVEVCVAAFVLLSLLVAAAVVTPCHCLALQCSDHG